MEINTNSVSSNIQNNITVSKNQQASTPKELLFKPNEKKLSDNIAQRPPKNFDEFKKFIADMFAIDANTITAKTKIRDLGLDDLDFIYLILKLEQTYHDRFNEEKITQLKTVGDLMNYIQEKTQNNTKKP